MDLERFEAGLKSLGLSANTEQVAQFCELEERLYTANEHKNFTRIKREDCMTLHFLDSLLIAAFLGKAESILDLGTGAGFPAIPLAILFPALNVVGLDSNAKMLNFMDSFTLPNLSSCLGRAEEVNFPKGFDVVTGRALAPLAQQLEVSAAHAAIGGRVIPMRSISDKNNLTENAAAKLGLELTAAHEVHLPGTEIVRLLPVYIKVKATPKIYPRRWAEIKKSPLS